VLCHSLQSKEKSDVIVFLDDRNNFEEQLIADGFQNEIRKSIASFDSYNNGQHREDKEPQRLTTRVLPLPALALTYKAPSSAATIDFCVSESIICLLMIPPQ
jgi:hypothetical protein